MQEKGVDVRRAVDVITEAVVAKKKDKIAIFSSDTDLIPAIDRARANGAYIIYVCFGRAVNRAVSGAANETVSISNAIVEKLYKEAPNGK